jgi:hypothetical protein
MRCRFPFSVLVVTSCLTVLLLIAKSCAGERQLEFAAGAVKWQSTSSGATTTATKTKRGLVEYYIEDDVPSFEGTGGRPYEANNCPVTSSCGETEFCGNDAQCHDVTCANVYEFGLQDYTHRNNNQASESEELQCVEFASATTERDRTFFQRNEDIECYGLNELPMAVSFRCGAQWSGRYCPSATSFVSDYDYAGPYVPFNQKCTAKTTKQRFFSCYEISPQTDRVPYFSSYAAETEDLRLLQAENSTMCSTVDEDGNKQFPRYDYGNRAYYNYYRQETIYLAGYSNGLPSDGRSDEFNVTLAGMAMIVRSDLLFEGSGDDDKEGFPRCAEDGGCGYDEFCGIDKACHFRNCENFYDFGPTEFTGNKTNESEEMSCFVDSFPDSLIPPCDSIFPTLVHLTCQPLNVGISSFSNLLCNGQDFGGNRTKGRYAVANRVCRASPNAQQEFVCYDMAPTTNSPEYFQDYVDLVSANPGCDGIPEDYYSFGDDPAIWVAEFHEVESCFTRPGMSDCAHGYRSRIFDPTVMMPPAMHTTLTGPYLEEGEDSAFCTTSSVLALWGSLVLLPLLIILGW